MSRDLKIISASMLTWGFGEGMFHIFQTIYIQQFGADPLLIGTILGVNGFVMAASQIPSGLLADKFGCRLLMRFCWICGVIATWTMALAPSLGYYIVGLLLYGLTSSVMAPLNTYIQGARGQWSVGKAVSFISAVYSIGGILGPIIGGLVGELSSLRMVYFVSAGVFTASTLIVFFASRQDIKQKSVVAEDVHFLRNRHFVILLLMIFVIMFAAVLPQPLTANFLQNQRGLSIGRIGELGSLGALGSVILMLIFGHFRADRSMQIGQAGLFLFAMLIWWGRGLFWYGAAYVFLGGYRLCRAMTVALVRPWVREFEVGFAFGVVESLNALALMLAPVLAGWIYTLSPAALFPVSAGLLAFTMATSFLVMGRMDHYRNAGIQTNMVDEEGMNEA